jgi:hypothetical protein
MSKHLRTVAVGAAVVAGLAVAPALDAQDYLSMSHGPMIGKRMMDQGGMMGGMMSSVMSRMRNMMGMSGGMGDMAGMMEHCSEMMQGMDGGHGDRPNDQWRSPQSEQRDQPQG